MKMDMAIEEILKQFYFSFRKAIKERRNVTYNLDK
jgi:hypothetical protein